MNLKIHWSFHKDTNTFTYLVWDEDTRDAVVIDSVMDFKMDDFSVSHQSAQELLKEIESRQLKVHYILETHVHADHLTASQFLKQKLGSKTAINKNITLVQQVFKKILQLDDLKCDGSQFDELIEEDRPLQAGSLTIRTLFTPGHTPACSCFLIGDALFTGDSIFMPDFGTGRCDFPGGSAEQLYRSITSRIYSLPEQTRIFVGHDYGTGGREIANQTTVAQQLQSNVHIKKHTSEQEFVSFRTQRDATLSPPKLIYPSLQVNLQAGRLPDPAFIKMPITLK